MNNSPLRILLLIKTLGQGGAERQCCTLARQLAEAGHKVCVVVYDINDVFYSTLLPDSVEFVSLGRWRWNMPGLLLGLYRKVAQFKPDIVYGFMSHSNLLLTAMRPFIQAKIICGIRSSTQQMAAQFLSVRLGEWIHRIALRFADLIITNSHVAKSELLGAGLQKTKITVIANGIDTNRFEFDPNARAEIRDRFAYSENVRVIGLFARLHPMKGHDCLFKAFSEAATYDQNLNLLLIGSGNRSLLEKSIEATGLQNRIIVLDQCHDIERYYSAIDMYCSASLYGEGFPNALAEAMATGVPCIATDVGDSAFIISNLGQLVTAGDVQQLSNAIRNSSFENSKAQAEARRQHIAHNFGLQQLGERTIVALRKTLER